MEFNKDLELGFEISESVQKALGVFRTIEEGKDFTQFIKSLKLKELLASPIDAHKIAHIARNYRTDDMKYVSNFKKTVTATNKDLLIRVDDYSSIDLI